LKRITLIKKTPWYFHSYDGIANGARVFLDFFLQNVLFTKLEAITVAIDNKNFQAKYSNFLPIYCRYYGTS